MPGSHSIGANWVDNFLILWSLHPFPFPISGHQCLQSQISWLNNSIENVLTLFHFIFTFFRRVTLQQSWFPLKRKNIYNLKIQSYNINEKRQKNVHQHHTRQAAKSDIFLTRKFTLQYGLKSVRYAGAKSWNIIPIQIKQAVSIHTFRRQVKHYLLSINYQS